FTSFRARLDSSSGFQSTQFREIEAVLTEAGRPSLWDSYIAYLSTEGYAADAAEPQAALLAVYRDDGGAAQVTERLVDLDEGLQEWRYRHVKMVERTIGDKSGTGGSSGAEYLRRTLFRPVFPDLW